MFYSFKALLCLALGISVSSASTNGTATCTDFVPTTSSGSNLTIKSVEYVGAYDLVISNISMNNTVSFCRVSAVIEYSRYDPNISLLNFELWLPGSDVYNERYLSVGNGGFAGVLDYSMMLLNLEKGYAVAAGDSGHTTADNGVSTGAGIYIPFFHNHDQVLAWIRNSIAMFTSPSQEFATQYYGGAAKYKYYSGCSTGGGQAYALALYHPTLFDGISAGSPGNDYANLMVMFLYNYLQSQGAGFLPQSSLDLITDTALDQCDELDGLKDGLIENPLACNFSVSSLQCIGNSTAMANNQTVCLTSEQVTTAKALYTGPYDTRLWTGTVIYPGFSVGSEREWVTEETTLADSYGIPLLQNLVFNDLSWDPMTFDFGTDMDLVNRRAASFINHMSPDLRQFQSAGHKILVTQGWTDPLNPGILPINHLHNIETFFNGDVSDWYRLFMVPGGGHCGAVSTTSNVPSTYATLEALAEWVENGKSPEYVISSGPPNGDKTTRKLCPWPQVARYSSGNLGNYTSFDCV
ncbi:hypothetical protein BP5796_03061 [Coleophoma crateriformis]|uniref:Carboxylic ester hydrolase n=1 Tax=Coleophoma crateriformis TaxID=565419 RepID=A0A3D8SM21_9HELO|nr:hypothetical protein BP5796_03061 [Coleophoma crateriformis]